MLPSPLACAIRDALVSDLPATARLHVRELAVGLFPRLGRRFVGRWHRAFQQSSHAVALSAVRIDPNGDEQVIGFLIGATDRKALMQELVTRHRNALLARGALALVLRPPVLARFLRTRLRPYLRRLRNAGPDSAPAAAGSADGREWIPTADLTAIVITPNARGTGAGSALVEEFLHRCAGAGAATAELVTVCGPSGAAGFYSHTGWTAIGRSVTRDGVHVERFRRSTNRAKGD